MQDNGKRLTSFVQNVLSYATLKVDRYEIQNEVADINACLREIAEFWAQRFQDKAIAFYFFPDDKLPAFAFDWYKVQHVVSNLLDNAVKYTPSGPGPYGCTSSLTSGSAARSSVNRSWSAAAGWWPIRIAVASPLLIQVPESLPSISRKSSKNISVSSPRVARAEGHGLGLAIARRSGAGRGRKNLGGKRTGQREQVLVPLPLGSARETHGGGGRIMSAGHILVVDDEPGMRRYLQTVLELDSYRVSTAADGEEALTKLQRDQPDVVLLDMVMPGPDGLETLRRIRESRPTTKVVMLSCVRDTRKVAMAMRLGAHDYLSKPVQKEEMDDVLRFCLDNPAPSAPGIGEVIEVIQGIYFFAATEQMRQIRAQALQVARFDFPVLVLGESGTGKEVLARMIHKYSDRAERTFLKVNCAAMPSELLESELFGYEPGAFTGAVKAKPGKFELCNKGTILLDEIGEMSPALQAKLLQVLQDGQFSRLGGRHSVKVDVRVLAATNINMAACIANKSFREDLYYRLSSFVMNMPSLRERREEIPMMLRHFMIQVAERYACPLLPLSSRLVRACENYSWPGNIRELENFVKRYLVLGDENAAAAELENVVPILPHHLWQFLSPGSPRPETDCSEFEERSGNGSHRGSLGRKCVEPQTRCHRLKH